LGLIDKEDCIGYNSIVMNTMASSYTPKEVATELGINRKTAYRWIKQGLMGAVKLGGRYRVSPQEVDRLRRLSGGRPDNS